MRPVRSVVLLMCPWLGAVAFTGCVTKPKPAPAAPPVVPATAEQAAEAQNDLSRFDPNAKVGHVSRVNESMMMAAVTGIPISAVHHEDTLVFTDSKQNPIANGTIKRADESTPEFPMLIVEYTPTAGGRSPVKGDLAVYIPSSGK